MNRIKAILVDDETGNRELMNNMLKDFPVIEIVGEASNVEQAYELVCEQKPDLVFLDIQMPALTGIQVMEAIKGSKTKVILTTAYAEYALEGYKHDVVDYLLKPVTFERFLTAIAKAKQRMAHTSPNQCSGHVLIKTEYRLHKTDYADILYIQGLGDYLIFYTGNGKLMTLERMRNMESKLPPECFVRIHKSYIVNIGHIHYLEKSKIIIVGQHLPIGDTYKDTVKRKLGW